MKRNILRKALSLLLVLVMLIPLASPAFAAGETEESIEPSGEIIAFAALPDNIRWQNTTRPEFPETVSGTVYGEPSEIPVTWQAEQDYGEDFPQRGLYVFDALPGEGYAMANGVEAPRITVYIPAQRMMMRMGGGGTDTSPLEITTAAQLAEIATLVNAGRLETFLLNDADAAVSLKLMNDLDLSAYGQSYNGGKGWVPIGIDGKPFKGSFDGDGHIISGLYINDTGLNNAGLFGYVSGGNITSLSLSAVNIHASTWVGAIAGNINGSTSNIKACRVNGTVSGVYNIGGVVGWVNYGLIHACSFAGMVSGSNIEEYTASLGGVAGKVTEGSLQHSYSTAAVSGSEYVGGIVGKVEYNSVVEYCYATGAVKGSQWVGGIAGMIGGYCNLQNCAALNSAVVASTSDVGRVAGAKDNEGANLSGNVAFSGMPVNGSTVTSSDYTDINGADMTAAAINADGSIVTRFADTDIWTTENGYLPGFGAAVDMPVHIMDDTPAYFTGDGIESNPYAISTPAQLAKLAELVNAGDANYNDKYYALSANIDLSGYGASYNGGKGWTPIGNYVYGYGQSFKGVFNGNYKTITGLYINDSTRNNAGLFGDIYNGTVKNLGIVNASITAKDLVGGVAGVVEGSTAKIEECYVSGSVCGSEYIGGVVGSIYSCMMKNCYSTADVTGSSYVGGVVGLANKNSTVQYCYSTGAVTCDTTYAGGIVGLLYDNSKVQNCVALNPSVNANSADVGRIAGSDENSTFSDNAAFAGMLVNITAVSGGAADKNGADKSAGDIAAAIFFQGVFDSQTAWTYETGKLPVLAEFETDAQDDALPGHISGQYFAGGTGSQSTPYEIATAAQLAKLAELVNAGSSDPSDYSAYSGKYYKLTSDIDLSAYGKSFHSGDGWSPIGNNVNSFRGEFNGNGKTITGLYINNASRDYAGLFGYITSAAGNVHDLVVKNAYINAGVNTGIVAGYTLTSVKIEKCFVSGTVKGSNNVGGVAGYVKNSPLAISQCAADVAVSGTANVGGVVGTLDSAVVQNCYATGNVSGTSNTIGGIGGNSINGSAIKICYATGNVSTDIGQMYVGGIAGHGQAIENCVALGKSVKGHEGSTYRVTGVKLVSKNNYAFSAMTGSIGMGKTADNVDGADVTIAQANTLEFWTTAGNWNGGAWDDTLWIFTNGKLPILKNLPANLQSGDGGLYLTERDIANATVDAGGPYTYTGSAIEPSLSVTFDGMTLVKDADYTVTYSDNTNAGQATVTLSGIGNFTGAKTANFTIVPKALTTAMLTVPGGPFTYTGEQHKPNVTVMHDGKMLTLDKDYEVTYGTNINAGTTVWVSVSGKGNYSGNAGTTFTIGKAELTVTGIAAKAYDGTTGASGLALTFQGLQNGEELGLGIDYGVSGMSFNSADAGTDKTVTGMVALNYTTKANNYSLATGILSLTGQTINKAPISDVTMPFYVPKNYATTLTTSEQQVSAVLNDLTNKDLGSITWSIVSVDNDDAVLATTPSIGLVNFPLSIDIASVADAGKTATIKVTVSSMNYADFTASMIVTVTAKTVVTISGITTPNKTYDGTAFEPIGTITVTGGSVPISELVWNYKSTDSDSYYNATAPTKVGAYELTISVPHSNASYVGEEVFAFAIEKRQITLTADNKSVIKGGSMPELTYTVVNLAPGKTKADALTTEPTLDCPTFDANTLGSCPITLTGGTATDNYTITTRADGVLTVAEQTYTVTFDPNGGTRTGGGELTQTVSNGSAATAPILSRSNHTFISWDKPFDNVTSNLTVTANWRYDGGGGDSGGGGGSNTPTTPTYNVHVKADNGTEMILPVTVNKDNRTATVDTGSQKLTSGETVITIPSIPDIGTYSVGIPVPELSTTDIQGTLTFDTHTGSVTVPLNMLTGVEGISGSKAEISIGQGDKENLPDDVKAVIGDKPLIQLTLSIDGKQTNWSNPSAPVTVSIPYTPTAEELANQESINIWYIDGSGKAVSVPNGRYDPATGTVTFFTTHFSDYAVAYVHKTFSDLGGAEWARKAIEVMSSKGITSGTGNGTFSPGVNITRADYMVLLINTLGLTADFTENFDDVKPGAYYYSVVGAAKKLGIAAGSGNNRFNPTESISRQDMMVLAARALEKYQGLKAAGNNTVLEKFSDKGDIAEYAAGSLAALADAGMIEGSGNKLNPRSYTTRAEAAVFLYNIYNEYTEAPIILTYSRLPEQMQIT